MAKADKGIAVQLCHDFELVWNDKGSGGKHDGAFYRPKPPAGYYAVGHYGQGNYGPPSDGVIVVKGMEPGTTSRPTGYTEVWTDRGSGANMDGSFWLPKPPAGYIALGLVCNGNHSAPGLDEVVCVRQDLVLPGKVGAFIWDDSGTGAKRDFGSWAIEGSTDSCLASGTFVGVASHSAPSIDPVLHCLDVNKIGVPEAPTRAELDQLIKRYGPKLYLNLNESYQPTSAEWFLERAWLLDKQTGTKVQAVPNDLPTGAANKDRYQLLLKDKSSRGGDLAAAKAYVHAKGSDFYTDIQFWFLSAYNGPGTARIKWLVFDTTVHSGNPSLAPLGEHEGDWEHVTIRISNTSRKPEQVYFSQHAGGIWVDIANVRRDGDQIVVYSSLNGHASYPSVGVNYSEHRKYNAAYLTALEFFLRNDTDAGPVLDCGRQYELVSADYLGADKPAEPVWLNYLGRWGASSEQHLTVKAVQDIIVAAFGPILGFVLNTTIAVELAQLLLSLFVTEDQDGPSAPKAKGSWAGPE